MRMIGETASGADTTQLTRMNPSLDLINSIVAVIHPIDDLTSTTTGTTTSTTSGIFDINSPEYLKLLSQSNVAGFIWLVQIEIDMDNITFISPCPGALPSPHILVGSLKYVE